MKKLINWLPARWTSSIISAVQPPPPSPSSDEQEHDPSKITINTAYKTRWIWYHTILALELLMTNILLIGILVVLSLKL